MRPRVDAPPRSTGRAEAAERRRVRRRSRLSIHLVTVGGIELRVHLTFLLLVALVALGSTAPGGPGLLAGQLWLAALFGCVVVHELAHSWVARRHGIGVLSIDLLPIGGVSRMERMPEEANVELRMAAAGPAASIVLATVLATAATLAGVPLWPPTLAAGAWLARLAWANVLLGAFNLVPAFPLDGGRVLRAGLERRLDRRAATRVAAQVGRVLAAAMIAIGLLWNFWLVLIGLFVYAGSLAEESAAELHELVRNLCVRDVMIESPIVLTDVMPADGLARALDLTSQQEFPVVRADGTCLGLVTTASLAGAGRGVTVGDLAEQEVTTLAPGVPLEDSGLLSGDEDVVVVVTEGRIVGLARSSDAVHLAERLLRTSSEARPAAA